MKKSDKLTLMQYILAFLPFVGTISFLVYLLFTEKYYTKKALISLLKACAATFITGCVLMIIGLFSYIATLIISVVLIGIIMNIVFFKSYNKKDI